MRKTVQLIISGQVQGIGYRKWMQRRAKRFGVVGWVKNRTDGAVETLLQGEQKMVDHVIQEAWNGPPLSQVTNITIEHIAHADNAVDFIVIQ